MESYRGWTLREGRLHSWTHNRDTAWESSTVTAVCNHGCDVAFCLENHQCGCGIYSRKSLKALIDEYPQMDIYGVIYNHGVVFEGASGLRAEKVTIRALFTSDFHTGKILERNYPGVAILMPPPEISERKQEPYYYSNKRHEALMRRRMEILQTQKDAQQRYPGGFNEEKTRLGRILKGKSRQELIEFAKEYSAIDEWAVRVQGGPIEKRTRKAKPGDMVFEANDDTHPYIFIGSCRPNMNSSMRYLLDRNGVLVRRANIRRWDEEPGLMEARKQAIEEWE